MSKSNRFHPLKVLASGGYILGVISFAIAMVLGFTPAATTFGQEAISCPLSSGTIVNISNGPFIRSDFGEGAALIGPLSVSIPAGSYRITLVSYDDHTNHTGPDQPDERWFLILRDSSGSEITRSQSIADLPGPDSWLTQETNANLTVSRDVASVVAYHAAWQTPDNPNSIVPVCASLVALQVDPTATPIPPTNTPVPPTNTPLPPTETPVPPTESPDPTATPDPGDPTATPIPATQVPPTDVPPPLATSPAVLIPVTGIDFGGSSVMMKGLFSDLGIAFLGFGLLMHGAWLRFGKEK
jgi:hypothetical protein